MNINGVQGNKPVQKVVGQPIQKSIPTDAPVQNRAVDKLELSGMSHLLGALKSNDIRADKVAQIKAQIDAGTYEDDHKLDGALDGLLDDLSK